MVVSWSRCPDLPRFLSASFPTEWNFIDDEDEDEEEGDLFGDLGKASTPSSRRKSGAYSGNSRAASSGNAFYLGGGGGGGGGGDDLDDIPMGVFSPSDGTPGGGNRSTSSSVSSNHGNHA